MDRFQKETQMKEKVTYNSGHALMWKALTIYEDKKGNIHVQKFLSAAIHFSVGQDVLAVAMQTAWKFVLNLL